MQIKQFHKDLFKLLFALASTSTILLIANTLRNQKEQIVNTISTTDSLLIYEQIQTDTLFESNQIISIIRINKEDANHFQFDLAHHSTELKLTSQFAEKENALAAINGGFFDMDNGGSVTYLEENDTVFQRNIPHGIKWAVADWAKTGAVVIDQQGQLKLTAAKTEEFYEQSKAEQGVLITGPTLLLDGIKTTFRKANFILKRHPRTCLCETETAHLLLVVDRRKPQAQGMSILELQDFLISQNCINAINLDGGGSSAMWLKEQGIVNHPSDIFGERKVANSLLIKAK